MAPPQPVLSSFQEAMLYHNQTAELRELLEFTHMYLQSDDEVSALCFPELGSDGDTLDLFLGPQCARIQPQPLVVSCHEAERFAHSLSRLSLPSPASVFSCPLSVHVPVLLLPGPAHMVPPPGSPCHMPWLFVLG